MWVPAFTTLTLTFLRGNNSGSYCKQLPTLQYATLPSLQKRHILTQNVLDNDILNMNEALCSILSGEDEWCFDTDGRSVKFNKDGTGEVCRSLTISLT